MTPTVLLVAGIVFLAAGGIEKRPDRERWVGLLFLVLGALSVTVWAHIVGVS